ncbi:MAG: hypothetical protein KIT74_08525 [Fimbriimonadales bacterium]|nr:hypothetical protein [Fimbriimonadales bacterium]
MKEVVLVVVSAAVGAVLTAVAFAGSPSQSTSDVGPWGVVQSEGAPQAIMWNRNTAESYALVHDLASNPPRFYWVRITR